jgi:hypothetical protein
VRTTRVWRRVLGVEHTVIESVDLESEGRGGEVLVAQVRPKAGVASRCSRCQRRCAGYDSSARDSPLIKSTQTARREWLTADNGRFLIAGGDDNPRQ